MTALIPADTRTAAARAFIRTAAQSLAGFLPIGAITLSTTGEWWAGVGLAAAGTLVSALLAGGAAYLSIISKGIPEDYQPTPVPDETA